MQKRPSFIDTQVGARVRELRTRANFSVVDAASLIGISNLDFDKAERGEMRLSAEHLRTLASKFGVRASDFFDSVEFPAAPTDASTERQLFPVRQ